MVSLVQFFLDLDVLRSCVLKQRGETADTLSVELKLSEHFLSISVGLSTIFLSMVSLNALHSRLHRNRGQLGLHLRDFLPQLIVLALDALCKKAGSPLVLQVLVGLLSKAL